MNPNAAPFKPGQWVRWVGAPPGRLDVGVVSVCRDVRWPDKPHPPEWSVMLAGWARWLPAAELEAA